MDPDTLRLVMSFYPDRVWRRVCKKTYTWYQLSPEDEFALGIYYLVNHISKLVQIPESGRAFRPLVLLRPEKDRNLWKFLQEEIVGELSAFWGKKHVFLSCFNPWNLERCRAYSRQNRRFSTRWIRGSLESSWNWQVTKIFGTTIVNFIQPDTRDNFEIEFPKERGPFHADQPNIEWAGFYIYNGWIVDLKYQKMIHLPIQDLHIFDGLATGLYNGEQTCFDIRSQLKRFQTRIA